MFIKYLISTISLLVSQLSFPSTRAQFQETEKQRIVTEVCSQPLAPIQIELIPPFLAQYLIRDKARFSNLQTTSISSIKDGIQHFKVSTGPPT